MGDVRFANKRLPNKPAGTNITWYGGSMAVLIIWTIGSYSTRIVIGRFTAKGFLLNCCVLYRAFEWPEPTASKDARWVLWGRGLATVPRYPTCDTRLCQHLLQLNKVQSVTLCSATGILPERASTGKPSEKMRLGCEASGTT